MSPTTIAPWLLPAPLQRRVEAHVVQLFQPAGRAPDDFAQPAGEAALVPPDSVSWRIFKNPVTLFIGGVAAVVLELAEPRVRSGVWDHTSFRTQPLQRLQRTASATVMTVYGPRSRAQAMIERVRQMHARVSGVTPEGMPYRANDPELLTWVQATAAFGFIEAYAAFVAALDVAQRDRCYAEGQAAARLYGAVDAPASQAELGRLFERTAPTLAASPIVHEFLHIAGHMPGLPHAMRPVQRMLVAAALDITPPWVRERLGLAVRLPAWQRRAVCLLARRADRLMLRSSAWVQSCRRLGLADDYLYVSPLPAGR